jgi:hypothetical protein
MYTTKITLGNGAYGYLSLPPTDQMRIWPAKARRISVVATERQTFQLSQCARDLLAVWKNGTGQTLINMQIVVFVENRF